MKLQNLNPKIISISQIRKDINILKKVLLKKKEAWVMRNQNIFFIAITPHRYKNLILKQTGHTGMAARYGVAGRPLNHRVYNTFYHNLSYK